MAEQQNTSTYHVPASREAVVVNNPEASMSNEAQLAYRDAMEFAPASHEVDPNDVDRRRIESLLGGSTVAAVEIVAPSPEELFDPLDLTHLVACGERVVRMRELKKGNFGLAA
jgi:hypothetical protein